MSDFDIDESIDVDISEPLETTSLDSSIDVMDSADIPEDTFEDVSLDEVSLENYEDFSESDSSDFSEVNDIMNEVETGDLEFEENVNDASDETLDVLEDVNAEELELPEETLEEAELTEEIEQAEENEFTEESELAEEMLEQTEENTELPEQNDALSNMRDYMYAHNYGREDFEEYSQDPEWQALNKEMQEADGIEVVEMPDGIEMPEEIESEGEINNSERTFEDVSLDEASLENYEDFSESDSSDFSEVNDIMNEVETDDLEFEENVNDASDETLDVLEDVNAEELELPEETLEEAELAEEIEQAEENEFTEESELAEEMLEQTEENAELSEQNDALSNMRDYMYAHNYGREDFEEYSQDPEWQALNKEIQAADGIEVVETADKVEITEESELAEEMLEQTEENTELSEQNDALSNMRDYMYAHNYGREDFEEYSQDPEWQALNKKLQEANGIEVVGPGEKILEQSEKIEPIENLDYWLKDINPDFDEFDIESPYCNNCGSCAYAVYQRLEGNNEICATAENIGYNSEMEALTGMEQVSMSPQEIEQRLLDAGDGAHAIIGIDRAEGPGHWFNAACINGKVVAIDGQDGSISEWPPDYGNVVNWEMSVRKETT